MCFTTACCGRRWCASPASRTPKAAPPLALKTERELSRKPWLRACEFDYYEFLGVARDASGDQIKSAYSKAALKWHPDRNPENKQDAEENFRRASEAYSVLSDPQKRSVYDRFGHAGLGNRGFESAGFNSTIFEEFQDILGDLFGVDDVFGGARRSGGRRGSRGQRGADLRYDMSLSFEDAAAGVYDASASHAPRELRGLRRNRRETGQRHVRLQDLRRARADGLSAGIFLDYADVPGLPGHGPGDSRCVRFVPRAGPHRARSGRSKWACRRAWIPERGCACRDRASREPTAGRRAISIFFSK